MRRVKWLAGLALALSAHGAQGQPLTIWAWERPEDLRFAGRDAEVAVLAGFIQLSGPRVEVRGRRFPLRAEPGQVTTAVVHIQIDPHRPLAWSDASRDRTAEAVLEHARAPWVRRLQVDFEVRASQRGVLLDLLRAVRAGLPPGVELSMTALASWCEEAWLAEAPVDEIAPMLFRMGPGGVSIRNRLAAGGDFAEPKCRRALAVSTDTPLPGAPAGRRVYLFHPRSWSAADFALVKGRVEAWSADR